jgi:hypothetical protein
MDAADTGRAAVRSSRLHYTGTAFAPPAGAYLIGESISLNLSTQHDSGYAPAPVERIAALGPIAPLALAALWEVAFAYEAGPLSTWSN